MTLSTLSKLQTYRSPHSSVLPPLNLRVTTTVSSTPKAPTAASITSPGLSTFLATRMGDATSNLGASRTTSPQLHDAFGAFSPLAQEVSSESGEGGVLDFEEASSSNNSEEDDPVEPSLGAQRSRRFTPFPHSRLSFSTSLLPSVNEGPDHLEKDEEDRYSHIPLTTLDSYPEIVSVSLPPTLCSSCGEPGQSVSAGFVQLGCGCVICGGCLCRLINASSNDPPRPCDCFVCLTEITSFAGVVFDLPPPPTSTSGTSPKTPKHDGIYFGSPPGLSPFRHLDWSQEFSPVSTPSSSTGSATRSFPTSLTRNAVVRVDNIPWDMTVAEVMAWLPTSIKLPSKESQALSIHILCNRLDGRTLNQLYIEVSSIQEAQVLVRSRDGGKLRLRPISVVLASQDELLEQIFPAWTPGFDCISACDPDEDGVLITNNDIDGLLELCRLVTPHAIKVPERPFLQLATILTKFPWHQQNELVSFKMIAKLFKSVQIAVTLLQASSTRFPTLELHASTLRILIESVLKCPAFRYEQKAQILSIAQLSHAIHITPPTTINSSPSTSSNGSLRSPTLDRVKNTPLPPLPTTPTRVPFTPSRYTSMTTLVEQTAALPPVPTSTSTTSPLTQANVENLASQLMVDQDTVRRVLTEGLKLLL